MTELLKNRALYLISMLQFCLKFSAFVRPHVSLLRTELPKFTLDFSKVMESTVNIILLLAINIQSRMLSLTQKIELALKNLIEKCAIQVFIYTLRDMHFEKYIFNTFKFCYT